MDDKMTKGQLIWSLCRVTKMNDLNAVREVLAEGADVNGQDSAGWSALHIAADRANPTIIRELLNAGADIGLKNDAGQTPADVAKTNGFHEVAFAIENLSGRPSEKMKTARRFSASRPKLGL